MSVYKIFILLVFNRECMECNLMTSFRILSSLECFLRYFQTEWSVFLPFSVNYSQVTIFQIMPVLFPHGQGEGGGVVSWMWTDRPGQGERVPKIPRSVQISYLDDPLVNSSVWEKLVLKKNKNTAVKYKFHRLIKYRRVKETTRLSKNMTKLLLDWHTQYYQACTNTINCN